MSANTTPTPRQSLMLGERVWCVSQGSLEPNAAVHVGDGYVAEPCASDAPPGWPVGPRGVVVELLPGGRLVLVKITASVPPAGA
jgi:hypothetical protein